MNFKATIFDRFDNEWNVTADVEGRGMYDDNGDKSGMVVEGFKMTDIILELNGVKIPVQNNNRMPDIFNEREIKGMEREGVDAFLQDWMSVQEDAFAASNKLFIPQNEH